MTLFFFLNDFFAFCTQYLHLVFLEEIVCLIRLIRNVNLPFSDSAGKSVLPRERERERERERDTEWEK